MTRMKTHTHTHAHTHTHSKSAFSGFDMTHQAATMESTEFRVGAYRSSLVVQSYYVLPEDGLSVDVYNL